MRSYEGTSATSTSEIPVADQLRDLHRQDPGKLDAVLSGFVKRHEHQHGDWFDRMLLAVLNPDPLVTEAHVSDELSYVTKRLPSGEYLTTVTRPVAFTYQTPDRPTHRGILFAAKRQREDVAGSFTLDYSGATMDVALQECDEPDPFDGRDPNDTTPARLDV